MDTTKELAKIAAEATQTNIDVQDIRKEFEENKNYIEVDLWTGEKERYYDTPAGRVRHYKTREEQIEEFGDKYTAYELDIARQIEIVKKGAKIKDDSHDEVIKKLLLGDFAKDDIIPKESMYAIFPPVTPNRETRRRILKQEKKLKK